MPGDLISLDAHAMDYIRDDDMAAVASAGNTASVRVLVRKEVVQSAGEQGEHD
jgi:hypothetical protein